MDNRECCGTCRFWEKDKERVIGSGVEWEGECRVESPKPFLAMQPDPLTPRSVVASNITMFPKTRESIWCGEYKLKQELKS